MKKTVERLREHCQGVVKRHEGSDKGREWAFGAISFAFYADLIHARRIQDTSGGV